MDDRVFACVTPEPIPSELVGQAIADAGTGAHVLFSAVVRGDVRDGRRVVAMSYEASVDAERTLRDLGEEARARWGDDLRVAIVHRTGRVAVGEASLVIAVAARHRDAAYQASRQVLEEFKVRSPFRKREHYGEGHEAPAGPPPRAALGA